MEFKIKKVLLDDKGNIVGSTPKFKVPESKPKFKVPEQEPSLTKALNAISKLPTRTSLEGVVGSRVNRRNYSNNGHWDFPEEMAKGKAFGFIYLIHNKVDNRCYIGKKQYKGTGKANKGVVSNWPWYISSSDELSKDIKRLGKDSFEFIVLEEYYTRGGLSYSETWSLCHVESPTYVDKWYNVLINKVSWRSKERVTDRHKERISKYKSESLIGGIECTL